MEKMKGIFTSVTRAVQKWFITGPIQGELIYRCTGSPAGQE